MSDFSDRPFVAGSLTGVRSFAVDDLGRLTGVTYPAVWKPGENVAECGPSFGSAAAALSLAVRSLGSFSKKDHRLSGIGCSCGFYAYFDRGHNPHHGKGNVLGLVQGYGVTTVGSRGFRSEKARLIALVRPSRRRQLDQIATKFYRFAFVLVVVGAVLVSGGAPLTAAAVARWGIVALPSLLAPVIGALILYLAFRSQTIDGPSQTPPLDLLLRNYPDVPVYGSLAAALRAHPLTPPPLPSPETDKDFWERAS